MSETREPIDPGILKIFARFFDGNAASCDVIDTSRGEADFRNTILITADGGEKFVLKLAANDFTFPERISVWQRTVEEYRALGYYCPRIINDKNGDFPAVEYRGRVCFAYAEEFSKYGSFEDRAESGENGSDLPESAYFKDIWSMTAMIAAKRFDYAGFPSAYCLFETFCPSDEMDEVLENALEWKKTAFALPSEFSDQVQRIWELWSNNRAELEKIYRNLPTSVFQADLNPTNILVDGEGRFMGVCDFNLCGKDVFLNYLMRENSAETIPEALRIASGFYAFSEEEKEAALPLFRCLKPLWYSRVSDLKKAGDDPERIRRCLDESLRMLTENIDLKSFMG